jgi:hypothetical protein
LSFTGLKNDLALVKLKSPIRKVPGALVVRHVALPSKTVADYEKEMAAAGKKAQCYVAGWGGTEKGLQAGKVSNDLLYAQLDIFPLQKCKENYRMAGLAFQVTQIDLFHILNINFFSKYEKN